MITQLSKNDKQQSSGIKSIFLSLKSTSNTIIILITPSELNLDRITTSHLD